MQSTLMKTTAWTSLLIALLALGAACGADGEFEVESGDEVGDELNLSLEGINARFDASFVLSDDIYLGRLYPMDAAAVQSFLERNPHGGRSWLAGQRFGGRLASEIIAEEGRKNNINPAIILIRLQAEQGLISRTSTPTNNQLNKAMGCACPDNRACSPSQLGFVNQIECGAHYLRVNYERSQNRQGTYWSAGRAKRSLDGYTITPSNHSTAAFYNYTPWRSGAHLTWQISRSYLGQIATQNPSVTQSTPWFGDRCQSADECPAEGRCDAFASGGMCVSTCDGTCADRPGKATTFCASLDGGLTGSCVQRAVAINNYCQGLPGTERRTMQRFVRTSRASVVSQEVCAPSQLTAPAPAPVEPTPDPGSGDESSRDAWVGASCSGDTQCNFAFGGEMGMCVGDVMSGAVCSLECAGYCPDRAGEAPTFCVSLDGGQTGSCLARAHALNAFCASSPGTTRSEQRRHIGSSRAPSASREVCLPAR